MLSSLDDSSLESFTNMVCHDGTLRGTVLAKPGVIFISDIEVCSSSRWKGVGIIEKDGARTPNNTSGVRTYNALVFKGLDTQM